VTRVAYMDPVGGLAGDMFLAAFLDAGAPRTALDDTVRAVGLQNVRIDVDRSERSGLVATHVDVRTSRGDGRAAASMRRLIEEASLPDRVRTRSIEVFDRLVAAEAEVHGAQPDEVVLHELGGDDTLVDICGTFALLDALGIERFVCAPVPLGRGVAPGDHGPLPVPGPATLQLLAGVPVYGVPTPGELVTPTGAALATAADDFGELPAMTVRAVGMGAGSREHLDRPNILRVTIGEATTVREPSPGEVVVLQTNVDDLVPELVPDVLDACLAAGALDAWTTPIQMKKGRPGVQLSVLGRPADERILAETMLRHSSTLGVRVQKLARYELDRTVREVRIEGQTIRIKIGLLDGAVVNLMPEHDDCASAASATGRPVKQIWAEALAAATAGSNEEIDDLAR
jgi:pyridinium-3,5-bisthiocarboxylic acid mononucleotide nickel chelatase